MLKPHQSGIKFDTCKIRRLKQCRILHALYATELVEFKVSVDRN